MSFVELRLNSNFAPVDEEVPLVREIGDLEPNEERQVSYYLQVEDSAIRDYSSSDENAVSPDFPKTVEHSLEIFTDELKNPIPSNIYTMQIDDGSISISMGTKCRR